MARALLALLLASGCAHHYSHRAAVAAMPAVAADHEMICYRLDTNQFVWGAVSAGTAGGSGAASTLMAVFDVRTVQYVLAGGSLALAVISATGTYLSSAYVKRYGAEKCQ